MCMKWVVSTIVIYLLLALELWFITAGVWEPERCFAASLPVFVFSAMFYVLFRKVRRNMDEPDWR